MRSIKMPAGKAESQEEILRSLKKRTGCVAHVRALLVRQEGAFVPVGGRIDISRPNDQPPLKARPVRGAKLVTETMELDVLSDRLAKAFAGEPFRVGEVDLVGHGMDGSWHAAGRTDDFLEYGASWPLVEFIANESGVRLSSIYDIYEAEGEVEALEGITACIRLSLGYDGVGVDDVQDARGKRFAIYLWDYRGVFREKHVDGALCVEVEPADRPDLVLAIAAHDDVDVHLRTVTGPREVKIDLQGDLRSVKITLWHGEEIVCERLWNERWERFRLQHDGRYVPPPVGASVDPFSAPAATGASIAATLFPFVADPDLARLLARDQAELDAVAQAGNVKSALLLIGSILEASLLDVLARNEGHARAHFAKAWPDKASANGLIDLASRTVVRLADGSTKPLLPPLTAKKGVVIVDHRDLVHPRAEIRGAAPIDMLTVQTMLGVLGEVVRDLREAHASGALDAYAAGNIV